MQNRVDFKRIYITTSILVVLLVVFIIETFSGGSENINTLVKMGAMYNPAVAQGQLWRLFTAQFLHIGIIHIASNAVMIFYLGEYLEPLLGHWRFLIVYLLSGIGGNLLSFALGSDHSISAGASTALFGMIGAMLAIGVTNRDYPPISFLARQAFALAAINLLIDVFATNIDIMGHIGGLITGFLLAGALGSRLRKFNMPWRVAALAVLIIYSVWAWRQGMVISY